MGKRMGKLLTAKKKGWDDDGIDIDGKKRMGRFRKLGNRWNFGTLCI